MKIVINIITRMELKQKMETITTSMMSILERKGNNDNRNNRMILKKKLN